MSGTRRVSDGACLSSQCLRLLEEDNRYRFSNAKSGVAIIINNINFVPESGIISLKSRETDHKKMEAVFRAMNFRVDVCLDLTADDILDKMREVACNITYDHTYADSFACAILSHGSDVVDENGAHHDVLLGVDGKAVYTRDILSPFKDETCPYLHGKPKLFFIETYCGYDKSPEEIEEDDGTVHSDLKQNLFEETQTVPPTTTTCDKLVLERCNKVQTSKCHSWDVIYPPLFKDFLIMYAVPPGHFLSIGDTGSIFAKCLTDVFYDEKLRDLHLLKLLTKACNKMAMLRKCTEDSTSVHPCLVSMLTKDMYFRR